MKPSTILIFEKARYSCPICNNKLDNFNRFSDYYFEMFDKYHFAHSIFCIETLNYLKYSCPFCGSSDRNRLYSIYFDMMFDKMKFTGLTYEFLDIAPDITLSFWIKKHSFIHYRSVDLFMKGVDDKADITNMSIYKDDRFDIILCSHVLEHIVEDQKALAELFRILKPGGFAIIMVPILLSLQEDLINLEWTSVADRWKYYGQDDHVRMYSKSGFLEKLYNSGFKVQQLGIQYFGDEVFKIHGINDQSVLYVVEK